MVDLLTLAEVARFLKVPKSTIYKLAREQRIPGHRVGKHWRFVKEEIESWMEKTRIEEVIETVSPNRTRVRISEQSINRWP